MNGRTQPGNNRTMTQAGCALIAAFLHIFFVAPALLATPTALHVADLGELYEIDVATGEYSLALTFEPPVECTQLTRADNTLFCADAEQFEGTWVRRLEPSFASVGWQVNFPDLEFPDGIAHADSLVYVVAHVNQPRRYFLLTLDPATGEELARVEIAELTASSRVVYSLAARGSVLWAMITGTAEGMAARRLDPATGTLHESFIVPGISSHDDADFGPDGQLFISDWEWNVINTAWCTDYWKVPYLGATPEHQFSHCWEMDFFPPPPTLAYFTLADRGATPVVEIPTLGVAQACVLAALLALAGLLSLRKAGGVSPQ